MAGSGSQSGSQDGSRSGSRSGSQDGAPEVEVGRAPSAALGEVIVSTLQGEGIRARLDGTRILVPSPLQTKAREILDFLRAQIEKGTR